MTRSRRLIGLRLPGTLKTTDLKAGNVIYHIDALIGWKPVNGIRPASITATEGRIGALQSFGNLGYTAVRLDGSQGSRQAVYHPDSLDLNDSPFPYSHMLILPEARGIDEPDQLQVTSDLGTIGLLAIRDNRSNNLVRVHNDRLRLNSERRVLEFDTAVDTQGEAVNVLRGLGKYIGLGDEQAGWLAAGLLPAETALDPSQDTPPQ